jgi:hypothetical protein
MVVEFGMMVGKVFIGSGAKAPFCRKPSRKLSGLPSYRSVLISQAGGIYLPAASPALLCASANRSATKRKSGRRRRQWA